MKTKLILALLITLTGTVSAQWIPLFPNLFTTRDYVGIYTPSPPPFNPQYPLHVVQNDPAAGSPQTAGYFDYTANAGGTHISLLGLANDPTGVANTLVGVRGEAHDSPRTFGGTFVAGNAAGGGQVTIGVYGGLFPGTGPYSAGISAGVYGDDWSTGGSGGMGPNWGGFFVGDVGSTTGYYIISDKKLKTNIKPMNNALGKIMQLKPSTYSFRTEEFKGITLSKGTQMGLIAQELEEVFPELIKETGLPGRDEDGKIIATGQTIKTVDYVSLIPVLISAMQEQQKQIMEQRELINDLINRSGSTSGMNEINHSNGFSMSQNEPNPFNGETRIKYTLPEQAKNAHVVIYDLSGKQIMSLPITEKGSSQITITSEKLAAGIYIYSIVADNKIIDSKKMIVAEK